MNNDFAKLLAVLIIAGATVAVIALMTDCEKKVSTQYYHLQESNAVLRSTSRPIGK